MLVSNPFGPSTSEAKRRLNSLNPFEFEAAYSPDADLTERNISAQVKDEDRQPRRLNVVAGKPAGRGHPQPSGATSRLLVRLHIRKPRARSLDQVGDRPEIVGGG